MADAQARARGVMRMLDDRLTSGKFLRNQLNKVFPDHWSFLLGELALYNFILLVLTGTFLTFFYNDSIHEVVYNGSYLPLRGVKMSEAYASVLHISFDVRAGLLIRQVHHWAALLFVAAILCHLCRIFFTGAFRKPREVNWLIGTTLLLLAIIEGFCGYSLPDDLLSGTGVRIAYSILESIPIVGQYLATFIFQGQYPGNGAFFPRLFILHVLLLPGLIIALIAAHLMIVWHQKHTQFPQPGRTERNVVGLRLWPSYALTGQGLMFIVFGVVFLLGAYAQINPIFLYGPYDPAVVSAGSQPDWYMFWLEGTLRLMPRLESHFLGHTVPWNVFVAAVVVPIVTFAGLYVYPFTEKFLTRDHVPHELLQRPRHTPVRTGFGAAVLSFGIIITAAGANDLIPFTFGLDMMSFTWALRVMVFVVPPIVFWLTRRACLRLQRAGERAQRRPPRGKVVALLPSGGYGVVDRSATEPDVTSPVDRPASPRQP